MVAGRRNPGKCGQSWLNALGKQRAKHKFKQSGLHKAVQQDDVKWFYPKDLFGNHVKGAEARLFCWNEHGTLKSMLTVCRTQHDA